MWAILQIVFIGSRKRILCPWRIGQNIGDNPDANYHALYVIAEQIYSMYYAHFALFVWIGLSLPV